MADQSMSKTGMKKAAVRLFVIGGTATVTKIASDALVERLFVQTAAEATSSPRTEDDVKMYEAYRGGIQIVGGAVLAKVLWKHQKDVALGIGLGGTVGGLSRIMTAYGWDDSISDLFRERSSSGIQMQGQRRLRALNGNGAGYTGPQIRERQRIPLNNE